MALPTAEDIARIARVSRSTVSRVVNNYSNVPAHTKERVLQAIKETGYVPHHNARNLAGIQSRILVLFVDNRSDYYPDKIAGSSFFGPLATYIIDSANRHGYEVIVTQAATEQAWERLGSILFGQMACGVLFIGLQDNDMRIKEFEGIPTVLVDYNPSQQAVPCRAVLNFDNLGGMQLAVNHVRELGRTHIGYITGNFSIHSGVERYKGFVNALSAHNMQIDEQLVVQGDFSEQSGYEGALKLMQGSTRPDAIIASNDECAIGVLAALEKLQVRVPEDVSVVGFDDIELSRYARPALSTVSAPKRTMAERAVELAVSLVEQQHMLPLQEIVTTTFIRRSS